MLLPPHIESQQPCRVIRGTRGQEEETTDRVSIDSHCYLPSLFQAMHKLLVQAFEAALKIARQGRKEVSNGGCQQGSGEEGGERGACFVSQVSRHRHVVRFSKLWILSTARHL